MLGCGLFDDFLLETLDKSDYVALFGLGHLEFLEGRCRMTEEHDPVALADAHASVGEHHVPAAIVRGLLLEAVGHGRSLRMSSHLALHHGRWRHDGGATAEDFYRTPAGITTESAHRLFCWCRCLRWPDRAGLPGMVPPLVQALALLEQTQTTSRLIPR
jgi:hypothetical protein